MLRTDSRKILREFTALSLDHCRKFLVLSSQSSLTGAMAIMILLAEQGISEAIYTLYDG